MGEDDNPQHDREPATNMQNAPSYRVSGDDPMTGAQASDLRTLAEQARELDACSPRLSKAETSRRIDALRAKLALQDEPPHTL